MSLAAAADFPRAFANAWSTRDAASIAALFAEDADFLTLTGVWAEGRESILETLAAELAGAFSRAKLVTGRSKIRVLAPTAAQVTQRFVLSGITHGDGSDAGRIGAVLSATLVESASDWKVVAAQFTAQA